MAHAADRMPRLIKGAENQEIKCRYGGEPRAFVLEKIDGDESWTREEENIFLCMSCIFMYFSQVGHAKIPKKSDSIQINVSVCVFIFILLEGQRSKTQPV